MKICREKENEELQNDEDDLTSKDSGIGKLGLFVILVIVTMIMIVTVYCYKRTVGKSLNSSINNRIQDGITNSISNYAAINESGNK